jgi:hypothetical protein
VSELPSSPSEAATRETRSSSTLSQGYFPPSSMSLSPTNSTLASPVIPSKRRRAHTNQQSPPPLMDESSIASGATPGHIPKRGARACTACRKGKNRCEGEVSNTYQSAPSPVPLTAPAGPSLPPRPGLTTYRLLVVVVNSAVSLAYSRNQRRRTVSFSPPPVSSQSRLSSPYWPFLTLSFSDVCLALKASML